MTLPMGVLAQAGSRQLGNRQLNAVFPGFDNSPTRFLRLLG